MRIIIKACRTGPECEMPVADGITVTTIFAAPAAKQMQPATFRPPSSRQRGSLERMILAEEFPRRKGRPSC